MRGEQAGIATLRVLNGVASDAAGGACIALCVLADRSHDFHSNAQFVEELLHFRCESEVDFGARTQQHELGPGSQHAQERETVHGNVTGNFGRPAELTHEAQHNETIVMEMQSEQSIVRTRREERTHVASLACSPCNFGRR